MRAIHHPLTEVGVLLQKWDRKILIKERMNFVSAKCPLKEIKSQIEKKQGQLNKMIIADIDRDKLLKYSVELDRLIDQYYSLELNKNRTK